MIRTAMLLGLLVSTGCASPFGVRGYYRYPEGINKQCHLKVQDGSVKVIVVEDRAIATYAYEMRDGRLVVDDKQGSVFTPHFLKLVDERGREYPKVLRAGQLKTVKEVELSPDTALDSLGKPADGAPQPSRCTLGKQ